MELEVLGSLGRELMQQGFTDAQLARSYFDTLTLTFGQTTAIAVSVSGEGSVRNDGDGTLVVTALAACLRTPAASATAINNSPWCRAGGTNLKTSNTWPTLDMARVDLKIQGRPITRGPIPVSNLFGSADIPHRLDKPLIFYPGDTLAGTLYNDCSTETLQAWLSFIGFKIPR